jgi:hypothetical protein
MKLRWPVYVLLAVVFGGSCVLTGLLRQTGLWALLAGVPGIGALFAALFQLARDDAQHQRKRALQHDQQRFDIGITSHMADVAFDKHVEFCEEYADELHATLSTLFMNGETERALEHASNLRNIQIRHAIWVTPEISSKLEPLEVALRKVGATVHVRRTSGMRMSPEDVEKLYDVFNRILDLKVSPDGVTDEQIAITSILAKLRDILAVGQLLALRLDLVALRRATQS